MKTAVKCQNGFEGCVKSKHNDDAAQYRKSSLFTDAAGDEPGSRPNVKPIYEEERIELQITTVRFVGFAIIGIACFILSLLVMYDVMRQYLLYERKTNFPGPMALFFGSLVTTFVVIYISYIISVYDRANAGIIFWLFILYNLTFIAWYLNLAVRVDNFSLNLTGSGHGNFYITVTLLLSLAILFYAWSHSLRLGLIALLPCAWIVFLIYFWIFEK